MTNSQPPALPAELTRPDAQMVVDALNLRLWKQEQKFLEPPAVTGSRGGNEALKSLLTALAAKGLIKDETTA